MAIDTNINKYLEDLPCIYYFYKVLSISIKTNYNLYSAYHDFTIKIKNTSISSVNFFISNEQKILLINEGYNSATLFCPKSFIIRRKSF